MLQILLQADFGTFSKLQDYGLPGLVILALAWVCYKFINILLDKQSRLEEFVMKELQESNQRMIEVIENNTNALTEIRKEVTELRHSLDNLKQKIG